MEIKYLLLNENGPVFEGEIEDVREFLRHQTYEKLYILDTESYKSNIQLGDCNLIKPNRFKPFDSIPAYRFEQVKPIIDRMGITLSKSDIRHMLNHGRSSLLPGAFKLSMDIDENSIVTLNIHSMKSDPPVQRKVIKAFNPIKGRFENHYVAYDKELHEIVKIPCSYMFVPAKIEGITISYKQRKALRQGRGIVVKKHFFAQINAVNRNIEIQHLY